jgi:hypoxanthine phosphoribosyltransferase
MPGSCYRNILDLSAANRTQIMENLPTQQLRAAAPSTVKAHDLYFGVKIGESSIEQRLCELGQAVSAQYRGKKPIFVGVLNGACVFVADLIRHCDIECELTFVRLSSYDGTASGDVRMVFGLEVDIRDRHIIVVEDIVDTGNTLFHFLPQLRALNPASLAVATLLLKPDALKHQIPLEYVGFEIPDRFVIGYGLDYGGLGRNLPAIYQLIENE